MAAEVDLDPDHPPLEEEASMEVVVFEEAHQSFLVEGPVWGYRLALVQLAAVRHPVDKEGINIKIYVSKSGNVFKEINSSKNIKLTFLKNDGI